jgi:phosphatidylglycerophosphate synthase
MTIRWELSTDLGRIVDPFVDKVIICGAFIIFIHIAKDVIAPWMVIVIVAREFFISSIRGFSESKGVKFVSKKDPTGCLTNDIACMDVFKT